MSEADEDPPGREIWIEKYRPERLEDIHGQSEIVERLQSYIEQGDLPHLLMAGPAGVGKCVTGETPVLTSRGLERMESIVDATDGFDDPADDLEIVTLDGTEFRSQAPSAVFSKRAEETLQIQTRDGNEIVVTPEHRLLVATEAGLEWTEAADLADDAQIARPLTIPSPEISTDWVAEEVPSSIETLGDEAAVSIPDGMSPWLARLGGLLEAGGQLDGSTITFESDRESLLEEFTQIAADRFHADVECDEHVRADSARVEIHSEALAAFLGSVFDFPDASVDVDADADVGVDACGAAIIAADETSKAAFLSGVYEAAGVTDEDDNNNDTDEDETELEVEIQTSRDELATLVSYLLAMLGIPSRRDTLSHDGSDTPDDHVVRVVGTRAIERFHHQIGTDSAKTRQRDRGDRDQPRAAADYSDTPPVQAVATDVCRTLNLDPTRFGFDSPGEAAVSRESPLNGITRIVETAGDRIEAAQAVLAALDRLGVTASTDETNIRASAGRTTAEAASTGAVTTVEESTSAPTREPRVTGLAEPPAGPVLRELAASIEASPRQIAAGTDLTDLQITQLLNESAAAPDQMTRVAARLRTIASGMISTETIRQVDALDRIAGAELCFDKVETVEPVSDGRRVYDLTVPESRNYVAGRVPTVMHNTTSAVAVAREIYGEDWQTNFLELNASDDRGIDVVRDRIKSFARESYSPDHDHTVIFLDEADSLCLPPGTEIVTGDPSAPEITPIETVSTAGEAIPSVEFATNTIQSDVGSCVDSGIADFFEMGFTDGRTVLASPTHPFFAVDDTERLTERELRELSPGDEIAEFSHALGVSRCETCGAWDFGRFCSNGCVPESRSGQTDSSRPSCRSHSSVAVSDGGLRSVDTAEISHIEYSHRGQAYNISMEGTPNFMLANGILTHNTDDAQSALRRTMEQFSDSTRFILSCNYSSKIIDPIQSRCAVFRYSPLSDEALAGQIEEIANYEGIELTEDGLDALVYAANGDMRRAINSLQAAATTGDVVDAEAVYAITSTARPEEIEEMIRDALAGDFSKSRSTLDTLLVDTGMAGGDVIDQLHRSVWEFDLSDREAVRLMERIGEADYRISEGANEQVQLEALLASLALERD